MRGNSSAGEKCSQTHPQLREAQPGPGGVAGGRGWAWFGAWPEGLIKPASPQSAAASLFPRTRTPSHFTPSILAAPPPCPVGGPRPQLHLRTA